MKRRFSWPYIAIDIILPLIRIYTALNYEMIEMRQTEYIALHIKVWKYRFGFKLYRPDYNK